MIVVVMSAGPAVATAAPTTRPRPLAVSVPADPAPLRPGSTGTIPIRVVNPGTTPLAVRITGQGLHFGDDGHVAIGGRDPLWDGRVEFPAAPVMIPADGYRNVGIVVHMPGRIDPDLYFVGFLVTPIPNPSNSVTYINQIGSYVTIDVPGPRDRALTADLHLPSFAFTTRTHAQLNVHNVGTAAAIFWGESDTSSTPGSGGSPRRFDRSLLPRGRSRTILLDVKPSFLVAMVTIHVHIIYPGHTDATTTEIIVSKHVLVVEPAAIVILVALLLAVGAWYWHRRKRRRQQPTNIRPPKPRPDRGGTQAPDKTSNGRSSTGREAKDVIHALEQLVTTRGTARRPPARHPRAT